MSCPFNHGKGDGPSRRGVMAGAGGMLAAVGVMGAAPAKTPSQAAPAAAQSPIAVPFYGAHQAGIATAQQTHTYFMVLDLSTQKRPEVAALLQRWTAAAARLTSGQTAEPIGPDLTVAAPDGGSAIGLPPSGLTLTFSFGAGLFTKDGKDRYGLASQRPAALADLPRFNGDQISPARSGGDLAIQACAYDAQVAFHAVRELVRVAYDTAQPRWAQAGFLAGAAPGETPRNLMGFKDGTQNPLLDGRTSADLPTPFDRVVWAGDEGPAWMRGGTYLVARRIRISLEHWDRTEVDFQEQVIGRHKYSGAPLGMKNEGDPLGLDRVDKDGNPVIDQSAHVRLGAAAATNGAEILRRGYAYNDGLSFTAERWPPWRQGMLYDAGLLFMGYQRDPRTGFTKIFETMSKLDLLNQFATHNGSGLFACPPGIRPGEFIGQGLFAA